MQCVGKIGSWKSMIFEIINSDHSLFQVYVIKFPIDLQKESYAFVTFFMFIFSYNTNL